MAAQNGPQFVIVPSTNNFRTTNIPFQFLSAPPAFQNSSTNGIQNPFGGIPSTGGTGGTITPQPSVSQSAGTSSSPAFPFVIVPNVSTFGAADIFSGGILAPALPTISPEEQRKEDEARALFDQRVNDVDQSWTLVDIVKTRAPLGWKELFASVERDVAHVEKVIAPRGEYVPLKKDIFNAYHWTPLDQVKVIILGQDPYHTVLDGLPQAVGAAFSTRRDCPLQPSLRNIYLVLQNTVQGFVPPPHGDLLGWARQGVLLLNTSLTTEQGCPGAHGQVWMGLITRTLKMICERRPYTVVMVWGKQAEKMLPYLGRLKTLVTSHPSPFSAKHGFLDCDHFNEANEYLISKGISPIDWKRFD